MLDAYSAFAREVGARAEIEPPPDLLVMYAPTFQDAMFEFYALVNLARISLDNLRLFLRPTFRTDFRQMPKSVTDTLKGRTDCPVYQALAGQAALEYLCDLRNCLVHFRSFATSDNAVVVGDHVSEEEEHRLTADVEWFDHMARARFRRATDGIVVNVYLPDRIFDRSTAEKLAKFTYEHRFNVLSQAMEFTRLVGYSILSALHLLVDPGEPSYEWSK